MSSRGQLRKWWTDSSNDAFATGSAGSLRRWRGIRTAARYGVRSDAPDGGLSLRHANPFHELANDVHNGDFPTVLRSVVRLLCTPSGVLRHTSLGRVRRKGPNLGDCNVASDQCQRIFEYRSVIREESMLRSVRRSEP